MSSDQDLDEIFGDNKVLESSASSVGNSSTSNTTTVQYKKISDDLPFDAADCAHSLFRLPGFMAIVPFENGNDDHLNKELQDIESLAVDQDTRQALFLRSATSIRWRKTKSTLECNARIVRWSDGSLSLVVGKDQFQISSQDMRAENARLCQSTRVADNADNFERILLPKGVIADRLAVSPFVTANQSHRRYLLAGRAANLKDQMDVRVKISMTTTDPEREKQSIVRLEQERIRAKRKQEAQQRAAQQRAYDRVSRSGLSSRFLEQEDDADEVAGEDLDTYEADFIDDDEESDQGFQSVSDKEEEEEDVEEEEEASLSTSAAAKRRRAAIIEDD